MIKDIKSFKLQENGLFIREPIDELSKKLNNDSSKKIIVTGGRGTGKSVLLYNHELKNLGNDKQTICIKFDSIAIFPDEFNEVYDKRFIEHYYEMIFCFKILNYIKENYSIVYEKEFKNYKDLLHEISKKTDDYINNSCFVKVSLDTYLKQNELSVEILTKLKKCLNISSLSLAIDRFDWTNESNRLVQEIISNFFVQFDKVIITTDDKYLQDKNNRKQLTDKDYSFIDLEYGKDMEVMKAIIKKRINYSNKNLVMGEILFPEEILDDQLLEYLIKKANGNISFIIECVNEVISHWNFTRQAINDSKMDKIIEYKSIKVKELEKMSRPRKLYL